MAFWMRKVIKMENEENEEQPEEELKKQESNQTDRLNEDPDVNLGSPIDHEPSIQPESNEDSKEALGSKNESDSDLRDTPNPFEIQKVDCNTYYVWLSDNAV